MLIESKEVWDLDLRRKAMDKAGLLGAFKKNGIDTSWAPAEAGAGPA